MISIKKSNKIFIDSLKENNIIFVIFLIVLFVVNFLQSVISVKYVLLEGDFSSSLADYYIIPLSSKWFCLVVSPLIMIWVMNNCNKAFRINVITRCKNLKSVWRGQVCLSVLFSLFSTIFFQTVSFIIGCNSTSVLINFNDKKSYFAFATQGRLTSDVSLLSVIIISTVFIFLFILFIELLFLTLYWFIKKFSLCLVMVLAVGILDLNGFGMFSFAGIEHTKWLPYQPVKLFLPILCILILYCLGLHFCNFREFLDEK